MNEKEGINILPVVGNGSNTDTATAMAMMSTLGMTDLNGNNRDTLFKLIYKLALNKLCDKDKMFNIREYFKL